MKGKTILASRLIYAMAWFFVAPAIPKILESYGLSPRFTGLVPVAFFLATGAMQVPSALISSKIGAKRAYITGLAVMGLSEMSLGVSDSLPEILASYFVTGVGASLFFSSAGGLLAELNPGRESRAMGLYNAFFSIGGTLGYLWGYVEEGLGFREASELLGVLTLVMSGLNSLTDYPNPKGGKGRVENLGDIVVLSLATSGVWGVYYLVAESFPSFLYFEYGVPVAFSSALASALTVSSALGGFIATRLKADNVWAFVVFSTLGVLPTLGIYSANAYLPSLLALGALNEMAISVVYSLTLRLSGRGLGVLGLAIVNSGNILGGIGLVSLTYLSFYYSYLIAVAISVVEIAIGLVYLRNRLKSASEKVRNDRG